VGNVGKWTLVAVLCGAACAKGNGDDDKKVVVVTPPDAGDPATSTA